MPDVDGVPEEHAVGDQGSLRMTGSPGRVEDRPRVVVRGSHRSDVARIGRGFGRLEVAAETQLDGNVEMFGRLGEIVLVDQHARAAVVNDELQLGCRQPPVEGNENRREFGAGEQRFEDVCGADGSVANSPEPAAETVLTSRALRQDWRDTRNKEPL